MQHDWLLVMLSNTVAVIFVCSPLASYYCQRWFDSLSLSLSPCASLIVCALTLSENRTVVCMWRCTQLHQNAKHVRVMSRQHATHSLCRSLPSQWDIDENVVYVSVHTPYQSDSCALFTTFALSLCRLSFRVFTRRSRSHEWRCWGLMPDSYSNTRTSLFTSYQMYTANRNSVGTHMRQYLNFIAAELNATQFHAKTHLLFILLISTRQYLNRCLFDHFLSFYSIAIPHSQNNRRRVILCGILISFNRPLTFL